MVNYNTLETGRVPRRNVIEIPIIEPKELEQILKKARYKRDACMIALLYLTGRRIGEILPLKKSDFILTNLQRVAFKTFNEKSFRQVRKRPYIVEKPGVYHYKEKDGTLREYYMRYYEQIQPEYNPTGASGQLLDHYVKSHLFDLQSDDYLFSPYRRSSRPYINQSNAYQILRKLDDRLWLHAMRHIDFTRMAEIYREDPVAMHRLTFHKRFESTMGYIKNLEKGDKLVKL